MLSIVNVVERRFLHLLETFDDLVSRGAAKQAARALEELRDLSTRANSPAAKDQMAAMVEAQQARLVDLRSRQRAEQRAAAAKRATKPPNAVCELCGQPFRRGKKDNARACSICRPTGSRSVRTVGGGLPTLGKGRR